MVKALPMLTLPSPCSWIALLAAAAGGSFLIRVLLSLLRGFARKWMFKAEFFASLWGHSDHWQSFVIGTLELIAFPSLISCSQTNMIGAWLGLKTLAQWRRWSEDREVFNLFLIGNGFVLIGAYIIAHAMFR
jgi:hypothetical protein